WTASSISHAIAATSALIRDDLLAWAQRLPGSPLAGAKPEEVFLVEGAIALKQDPRRAVSIADAMRQGAVGRLERQKAYRPKDAGKYARNTHSAIFAEVKIDEQLGVIRVTRLVS